MAEIEADDTEMQHLNEASGEGGKRADKSKFTLIVQGVAVACAVVNCVSIVLQQSAVVIVAGVFAVALAGVVFVAQAKLSEKDSLRKVQNDLRAQVNRLFLENNQLHSSCNRLEGQLAKLKQQESKLADIVERQGSNIHEFVDLVKENRRILNELKVCVKADAEQVFVRAVIESDWDHSNHISDQEIRMLQLRLKNIPGVQVNEGLLMKRIQQTDRSLASVFLILSELENDTLPNEERVFVIHEEKLCSQK